MSSATLHVLCLIRSKLHDLKRQRKERLGELLQVIDMSAPVVVAARVCCSLLLLTSHGVKVLTGMWDRLSVPVEYRARFVEKHPTLTQVDRPLPCAALQQLSRACFQDVLDAYEDEVRRQRHHIKG